jgi:Flp pilus assembly protein TadG
MAFPIRRDVVVRLTRDERGTVAMIFGFSIFILLGIAGLAIDGARAYSVAARGQAILDTASLAAAKMLDASGASDVEVTAAAQAFFEANLAGHSELGASFSKPVVTPHRGSQTVSVTVDIIVPTYFAGIIGFPQFKFSKESLVIYKTRGVELSMVLDITGSMIDPASSTGATTKLQALQTEAKLIVKKLLDPTPGVINTNRVAIAPFSSSVNVGIYHKDVAVGPSLQKDNCVLERQSATSAAISSDLTMALSSRSNTMQSPGWAGYPPVAEPGADLTPGAQAQYYCPASPIQPLTNDQSRLNSLIDGFKPAGGTAGHIGTAWGWNLISPNFGSLFNGTSTPAAYSDSTTIKAIIVMTDGLFNTAYTSGDVSDNKQQIVQSNDAFAELCTNMKANKILVFTIGFGLSGSGGTTRPGAVPPTTAELATARASLLGCASDPMSFFDAETPAQLTSAFNAIAEQLLALRVSG